MVGRASPDVARVEVRYATQPADEAVVRNGWWLVEVPADKPAPTEPAAIAPRANNACLSVNRREALRTTGDYSNGPMSRSPPGNSAERHTERTATERRHG